MRIVRIRAGRLAALAALVSLATLPSAASAQMASEQQRCVSTLNKDGFKVAGAQAKVNLACLKAAGKGKLTGTASACLAADDAGLVAKAKDATIADNSALCTSAPPFAYTSATVVNAASEQSSLAILSDLFTSDYDASFASCATDPNLCKCQSKVLKLVHKLAGTERKTFVKCKKGILRTAMTGADVARCLTDDDLAKSVAASREAGGKAAAAITKVGDTIAKHCTMPAAAFPGVCQGAASMRDCIDATVACRVCQGLSEMDALDVDCDGFDDGLANGSCVDPMPTTTTSFTTTTTSTSTTLSPTTTVTTTSTTLSPTTTVTSTTLSPTTTVTTTSTTLSPTTTVTTTSTTLSPTTTVTSTTLIITVCDPDSTQGCSTGLFNACAAGTATCLPDASGFGDCVPNVTPMFDACGDGIDNDCDGTVDNGCTCAPGSTVPCNTGLPGLCAPGVSVCGDGQGYFGCFGNVPTAEFCDHLDNDCDGAVDEDCICEPGASQACDTGLPDECAAGTRQCIDGLSYTACTATGGTPEVCSDGIDNDCDGTADDDCN